MESSRRGLCIISVSLTAASLFFGAGTKPAEAVPSYARQTGLRCSGCHYTPPELNPAGRRFKLLGYVDRAKDEPAIKAEPGTWQASLDLLKALPLSAMFDASLTQTKTAVPGTQNGTVAFPQAASLFVAGGWTDHLGSFVQITYTTADDHFSWDNTDIRYARIATVGGKELVWGLDLNNSPTVEDLWNSTPAWGYPWVGSETAPAPAAATMIQSLGQDVAGGGGYMMWNDHLYLAAMAYRTTHIGAQPNTGEGFTFNTTGVAPYWRLAWQQSGTESQFEIGTFGMYMKSTPNSVSGLGDTYTDVGGDLQWDLTIARHDVLSLRGTYIHQSATLAGTVAMGGASVLDQNLSSVNVNAEYHFGNRVSATLGWFDTWGTSDPTLFPPGGIGGSPTGSPDSNGFIGNVSWWPTQNLQLSAQFTGYTKFNGGKTDYDGAGRNASDNNTFYLLGRFIF